MESNTPSQSNQGKKLCDDQCSLSFSSSTALAHEKDIVLESPKEMRTEEPNARCCSRKHTLLKRYWKGQHLRVDKSSELREDEWYDDVSVEKAYFSNSACDSIKKHIQSEPCRTNLKVIKTT